MVSLWLPQRWLPWILVAMMLWRCKGQSFEAFNEELPANGNNATALCTRDPMDLVVLVDSSPSVTGANFNIIINFLASILTEADVESGSVRVALITFGKSVQVRFNFDSDLYSTKEELSESILETSFDMGDSFLSDAISMARSEVFPNSRPEVRKIMLVVTDGSFDITTGAIFTPLVQLDLDQIHTYIITVGLAMQQNFAFIEAETRYLSVVNVPNFNSLDLDHIPFLTCYSRDFLTGGGVGEDGDDLDINEFSTSQECNQTLDIAVVVDTSDLNDDNREKMLKVRDFLVRFIEYARVSPNGVRMAVMSYSTQPAIHTRLGDVIDVANVRNLVDSWVFYPGARNLAGALDEVRRQVFFGPNGDRPNVQNLLVIFSSGRSNIRQGLVGQYAQALKASGVTINAISDDMDGLNEMNSVVSEPADTNIFPIQSSEELVFIPELVFAQTCESFMEENLETNEGSDGLDLVFLLHFSNEMTLSTFQSIIHFMERTIEGADIDLDSVRVGAAIYRRDATVLFDLDDFIGRKQRLLDAIKDIRLSYKSVECNLPAGLDALRKEIFVETKGDRPGVPNAVVILTDSNSESQYSPAIQGSATVIKDMATVYAVGINLQMDQEMAQVASGSEMTYAIRNTDQLPVVIDSLRTRLPSLTNVLPPPTQRTQAPDTESPTTKAPATDQLTRELKSSEQADIVVLFHSDIKTKARLFTKNLKVFITNLFAKGKIHPDQLRVALVNFGKTTSIIFDFNKYPTKKAARGEMRKLNKKWRSGKSYFGKAVEKIISDLLQPSSGSRLHEGVPTGIVIITDSPFTFDRKSIDYQSNIEQLKQRGVEFFAVGIGRGGNEQLREIASEPKELHYQAIGTYNDLTQNVAVSDSITNQIRTLMANYDPPALPEQTTELLTTTPATTPIPVVPMSESRQADIIIAAHSSLVVTRVDFEKLLAFLAKLMSRADIDSGDVRVGLLFYGLEAVPIFYLDQFATWEEIRSNILGVSQAVRVEVADVSKALKLANRMFMSARGGPVPKALYIISDMESNQNSHNVNTQRDALLEKGVEISTVGINLKNKAEMENLATTPQNVYIVENYSRLGNAVYEITARAASLLALPVRTTLPPTTIKATKAATPSIPPTVPAPLMTEGPKIDITFPSAEIECSFARVDLVIIIDSSTSVGEENFKKQISFVEQIVRNSDVDTGNVRIGVAVYSTEVHIEFHLNQYTTSSDILAAVNAIQLRYGSTNTADSLKIMRSEMFITERGDRPDVRNVAIVITDGVSNINSRRTIPEAQLARDEGIHIYTVGIGLSDSTELDAIATPPASKNSFKVNSFEELRGFERRIFSSICPGDTTTTTTTTPAPTTTTTTTPAPTPPARAFDLVIMLDSSVRPEIFGWMTQFAEKLSKKLSINNEKFRVGLMRFSTSPAIQFHLNQYKTNEGVANGVKKVRYAPGQSNTAPAIEAVRTQMFRQSRGDRDWARNYILLLTGTDRSLNMYEAFRAAERSENNGTFIFTVGINIGDRTEINELSSHPLNHYQLLVNDESELDRYVNRFSDLVHKYPDEPPAFRPRMRPPPPTRGPVVHGDCTSRADVVFILDSSGSVGRESFWDVLNFTYSTISQLNVNSGEFRIGLLTFSDNAIRRFYLDTYNNLDDMRRAISSVNYVYGQTNTAEALNMARTVMFSEQNGDRPDVKNVVVIVTDGESNINAEQTIPEAMALKRDGVTMLTIAVGFTSISDELVGITSPPVSDNLIRVKSFDALEHLKEKLIDPLCTDVNMCASRPCMNGGFCIDGLRSYICECQSGFYGDHCEKSCSGPADVVFVLDSSNSVGQHTFDRMKEYTIQLVDDIDVQSCDVRIGAMKYSSAAMVQFNLGYFRDRETIDEAIRNIHYTRGPANMAEAIRALRSEMFNSQYDRAGIKNIAYLLTDGNTEINEDQTMQQAEMAIQSGIKIVPVGIDIKSRDNMDNIATAQGIRAIEADSTDGINGLHAQILEPVFENNRFCDSNPCLNGATCEEDGLGYECRCVPGYSGDNCERRCNGDGDMVFVVDTSRHVSRQEFRHSKRFIRSIVKRLKIGRTTYRVSIVGFSRAAEVVLSFGDTNKKRKVLSSISGLKKRYSDPNPGDALKVVLNRILKNARSKVPKYVIFMTKSMRNEKETIEAANALKRLGVHVIGVGIDLSASDSELLSLATSIPYDKYTYYSNKLSDLPDISDDIMNFICNENDLCFDNPCKNSARCVNIPGSFMCECPLGFAGKLCDNECRGKADVAFVLDASGSVGRYNFMKVKAVASEIVDELAIHTDTFRVGAVSFSSDSQLGFYMNDYNTKEMIKSALSGLDYEYGDTNTASALKMTRDYVFQEYKGDRRNVQDYVVLITDSVSNVNSEQTILEASKLKEHGAHVITVGIGDFDKNELQTMASKPASENSFFFNDFNGLKDLPRQIVTATCQSNQLLMCNGRKQCQNGGVCVPSINAFTCKCPRGFSGTLCEIECVSQKDIVFVLDTSSSVGPNNFRDMIDFVKALVEELSGASYKNRFSLITYSTDVRLVFSFGRYYGAGMINHVLTHTRYTPGSTNTAGALKTAKDIYKAHYGAREYADDIVILITDGQSNINQEKTIPAARELREMGAKVIAIGVGLTDYNEISQIASSENDLFKVSSFDVLKDVKADILNSSCTSRKIHTTVAP